MRYAKVMTASLAIHDTPAGKIVGYLQENERVKIVGEPITHRRTWWPIEQSAPIGVLRGWAAQGDGDMDWLVIEPEEQLPPPPRPKPPLTPQPIANFPPHLWLLVVVSFIVIVATCAFIWGKW